MPTSHHRPTTLIRWLLAGWLVALPWFGHAMPLPPAGDTVTAGVELPCHNAAVADSASPSDPGCPHCAGETLGFCQCCSFATSAALPALEVGTHFWIASREHLLLPRTTGPPADHPDPLYRPPIHSPH